MRNLKTKDYLGKARLVAASDRANAFTGFAGSEIKNVGYNSLRPILVSLNMLTTHIRLAKSKSRMTGRPTTSLLLPPT